jgi:HD-like signal output (HDOD) protein
LREQLSSEALLSAITGLEKLPSLPKSYVALMREVQSQSATAQTVARIVTQDLAMSAKVLQLVNSAFFGLTREVVDIERAVALLGVETINALLVSRAAFDSFDGANLADLESLWRESLLVGQAARLIAECEGASLPMKHAAYEAGLMHDIGKLVLATAAPAGAARAASLVTAAGRSIGEAEQEVFGCDHGVVGAYLLDLWGLPPAIVEAVAYHHRPAASSVDAFGPLAAVYVANALLAATCSPLLDDSGLDREWLARIGLGERLPVWRERLDALPRQAA